MNAQIVRPTRRWARAILTISFALSLMPAAAQAKVGSRSVLYTYFRAECFTWVRVAESPSGPKAEVTLEPLYAQDRRKSFRISQAEFDEIWATLNAPGVVKRSFDCLTFYFIHRRGHSHFKRGGASFAGCLSAFYFDAILLLQRDPAYRFR